MRLDAIYPPPSWPHVLAANTAGRRFDSLRLRTENPAAARFYEALGFRPCGGAADSTHVMELVPALLSQ